MSLSNWLVYEDGRGGAASWGFEIIMTHADDPNAFEFGTSEISSHTTNWDFGDGATASCPAVTDTVDHTYAAPGTYSVTATCHGITEGVTVDTNDPPVTNLTIEAIDPPTVTIGAALFTLNITGAGFAAPMLVARRWCVSTQATCGDWPGIVIDKNNAVVEIDTTDLGLEGTGGIDVVVNGEFSNQLQFPVTPP